MKVIAVMKYRPANFSAVKFIVNTPLFTPYTLRKNVARTNGGLLRIQLRYFFFTAVFIGMWHGYQWLFTSFNFPQIAKSYLLTYFVYILTLYLGTTAQAFCLLTKEFPVDIHNHPYLSKNINEFWGLRWNIWVRDWLHILSRNWWKTNPRMKIFMSFTFSGLFHEVMVNLPYSVYYGTFHFGHMMLYFWIQALGVQVDKVIAPMASTKIRRLVMWLVIVLPSPLFINKAFLEFFNL
jgi:D-alanyl-lipoteichoic acid acyltransferase DltB (MBOAT superfamily)